MCESYKATFVVMRHPVVAFHSSTASKLLLMTMSCAVVDDNVVCCVLLLMTMLCAVVDDNVVCCC